MQTCPDNRCLKLLKFLACIVWAAMVCATLGAHAQSAPLPLGASDFVFADTQGDPDKPIRVWAYKPTTLTSDAHVVMVMTGTRRNGQEYRDQWIRHAEQHHFLLLVPEFDLKHYPVAAYQFGNVRNPNRQTWTYAVLEHLFDRVRSAEAVHQQGYYLYGHSAGAQFVHRFMLLMPDSRVELAIAANAGSYTLPTYSADPDMQFPWTLDARLVNEDALAKAFSRPLVVMLAEDDTDPNHPALPREPQAMRQGPYRFARGQNFFATAEHEAARMSVALRWRLQTVPGVAHSDRGMSDAAVLVLFPPTTHP